MLYGILEPSELQLDVAVHVLHSLINEKAVRNLITIDWIALSKSFTPFVKIVLCNHRPLLQASRGSLENFALSTALCSLVGKNKGAHTCISKVDMYGSVFQRGTLFLHIIHHLWRVS